MKGIFITGTDTGVGKTEFGIQLCLSLKERMEVGVMKPIETGVGSGEGGDVERYKRSLDLKEGVEEMGLVRLRYGLAPLVASELEGKEISMGEILDSYEAMRRKKDLVIVEGAGGVLVPIYKDLMMIDLARKMDLGVILVVWNKLGCINHTLLSYHEIKRLGLDLIGVIMNDVRGEGGLVQETNKSFLEDFLVGEYIFEMGIVGSEGGRDWEGGLIGRIRYWMGYC